MKENSDLELKQLFLRERIARVDAEIALAGLVRERTEQELIRVEALIKDTKEDSEDGKS